MNNKKEYVMMKYSTAYKVLQKRAKEYYGRDITWLLSLMNKEMNDAGWVHEPIRVIEAYSVYIGSDARTLKVYSNGS
jgi:hypothetical protein